jgi:hypothetical protein
MSTKSETAITCDPATFLSRKDRALFDRARARAEAIVAEHGSTDPEMQITYATLLTMHRVVSELIAFPPDGIKEWHHRAGDGAILARFSDWCEREDAYSAAVLVDPDTDLGNQTDEIAGDILRLPAGGAEGLAVKMYLVIHDDCALSCPEGAPAGAGSLVRDLVRFAPVIEPRCRAFLDAVAPEASI